MNYHFDDDLGDLRIQIHQSISPPPLSAIVHRAHQSRRKRIAAIGSVGLVAAVVATVPIVVGAGRASIPPAQAPAPLSTTAPHITTGPAGTTTTASTSARSSDMSVNGLDFADPNNALAVVQRGCADHRCTVEVWVYRDGAWSTRRSPFPPAQTNWFKGTVINFGKGRLLLGLVGDISSSWYSADDGRTWTELPQQLQSVSTIPKDARLWVICADSDSDCRSRQIQVLLPNTGRIAVLPKPANFELLDVGEQDSSGRWWLTGRVDKVPAVAVSDDDGRSWQVHRIADRASSNWTELTIVGNTVWASLLDPPGASNGMGGLRAVYRSTDRGGTWRRVYAGATTEVDLKGAPIPQGDDLGICATALGQSIRLSPNGAFKSWACPADGWPIHINGGYIIEGNGSPGTIALSLDGSSWRTIPGPG
jgi:hypothetical protein